MVLVWIRRKDRAFDKELNDYLFTEMPIVCAAVTNWSTEAAGFSQLRAG